jgi:hypothetical protein
MEDEIKQKAYEKWEAEGRPDGQHERHWTEAEEEVKGKSGDLPKTWSSDHDGGVSPSGAEHETTTSEAIPEFRPESFKPGELASENK